MVKLSIQIVLEKTSAFGLFVSDIQGGHHSLRAGGGAPESHAQAKHKAPAQRPAGAAESGGSAPSHITTPEGKN